MTWRSLGMALMLGAATVASTGCTNLNMRPLSLASKNSDSDPIAAKVAFARLCERHGQSEQARQTYQSLLKLDPRMQVPLHRLAVMSAKQGKLDEAEEYFDKALAAGPPTAELLSDHGYCLYLDDRLEDAERVLRDAATIDPRYKAAKVNLGLVLGQQERLGESYAQFKDAVGEAQALANMAYVQAQRNDFQQAEMLYSRALSTDPEMRSAALALVQLNDIQKRQQHESSVQQAKASEPIAARQPKSAVVEDELVESRRTQPIANVAARTAPRQTEPKPAPATIVSDGAKSQEAPQRASNAAADTAATAANDFVPRQRATEIGHEWRTGEAPPQRTAGTSANTPAQPTVAASKPEASKPTAGVTAATDEANSRSFVPRQRVNQLGQNWGTGETHPSPVNVSVAGSSRPTQPASARPQEESRSTSTSTSSPIQVTTRQADKGTTDGTAKMTVTTPSPAAAQTPTSTASSAPAAQASATGSNPQVIDMTKLRDKAATPTRASQSTDEATISISLLNKPLSADKSDKQPTASAEMAKLPLARTSDQQNKTLVPASVSPTVHSAPKVQPVSQKAPEAKSATPAASKTTATPKGMVASRAKLPSQPRAPLTPPVPPLPPSRTPSKPTNLAPASTQSSAATISDSPTAARSSMPTNTSGTKNSGSKTALISDNPSQSASALNASGANAPARLESNSRTPTQPAGQPTGPNAPARSKSFERKNPETPAKAFNAYNDGQSPTMQSESSSVRYVDYRDSSAAQGPAKVQPAVAGDKLDYGPSTPSVAPSAYPSTSNPGSFVPNGSSFQGARILTPTSSPAATGSLPQSGKAPADASNLPGYSGASDSQ